MNVAEHWVNVWELVAGAVAPDGVRRAGSVLRVLEVADDRHVRRPLGLRRRIESEHFVLRYKPGEDEVVANMMLEPLEKMHADVAGRFGHEPDRKTVIELMPDHAFFSVRITGMPRIHTIAACTGPLIAIEVPREGPPDKHLGLFDWLKVLRHEYAHHAP